MRGLTRIAGGTWRGILWLLFPPLGWYRSKRAREARRHREMVRTFQDRRRW